VSGERLTEARWVLERQLAWINAAEVKVAVVITIQIAMLAGLGAVFTTAAGAHKGAWAVSSAVAFLLLATIAVFCAAMVLVPRRRGPAVSLLFFGRVADMSSADYSAAFLRASESDFLADWAAQIHRNAEIACDKHSWAGKALMVLFMSALPWVLAVVLHLR
jgi:Family of unknown function (DUF5706)